MDQKPAVRQAEEVLSVLDSIAHPLLSICFAALPVHSFKTLIQDEN